MINLSHEEKIDCMHSLNWDYLDKPEDMLAVIEGRLASSGAFNREKLFVRSLERLPWHYFIALWGVETIKELYTPEIARRIWPKERRCHYDFALAVLRREPVSPPGWGTEYFKSERYRFFSNRGHCT
ncbi:hypothetical protein AGMMS50293_06300 [Spirochaetia bacterium]|nr:hypothetical protein AGMMS50293_06300 [Spirochaetia bacterium]